jgi:hypothetical protein
MNSELGIQGKLLLTFTCKGRIMQLVTLRGRSEVYVEVRIDTKRTKQQN